MASCLWSPWRPFTDVSAPLLSAGKGGEGAGGADEDDRLLLCLHPAVSPSRDGRPALASACPELWEEEEEAKDLISFIHKEEMWGDGPPSTVQH